MSNYNMYDNLTVCEILDMAKQMLQFNSAYMISEVNEKHYCYFLRQTRRKLAEIMDTMDAPLGIITYDILVNRAAYKRYIYEQVGGCDLTPHELNKKREERLKETERNFKDVPVDGYDNFAIIKYTLQYETEQLSLRYLRGVVAATGKIGAFLWYDFKNENKNLNIPIITW